MTRKVNTPLLDSGDPFPTLELTLTDGKRFELPGELAQPYNVVLLNRGAWCPFCVAQLKAFQSGLSKLSQEGIGVIAFSVDPLETASKMVAEQGLQFPVGYGANLETVVDKLAVYYDPQPAHTAPYFHSAGFVLGANGRVLSAVYSSGAIGRLVWPDVLGLVQYVKAHS